jgi:hypothetical protein
MFTVGVKEVFKLKGYKDLAGYNIFFILLDKKKTMAGDRSTGRK